jgi:hypothetical protein
MNEFRVLLRGIDYLCKSNGTATAVATHRKAMTVFCCAEFVEVKGERYAVTEIGPSDHKDFILVIVPRGIQTIMDKCFSDNMRLCEVFFECNSELKEIGNSAFMYSGLSAITIPKGVKKIGDSSFKWSKSLVSVSFGRDSQLQELGDWAFAYAALPRFDIPRWCTVMTGLSLVFSSRMRSIVLSNENELFYIRENILMAFNGTFVRCLCGDACFRRIWIHNWVEVIADGCFYLCAHVVDVIFTKGSSLRKIGRSAFRRCRFSSISIPPGVTEIGDHAFYQCSLLQQVEFAGDPKIGIKAFKDCPLRTVFLPFGVELLLDLPKNCRISHQNPHDNEFCQFSVNKKIS